MAGSYSLRICSVLILAIGLQSAEGARKKHQSLLGKESGESDLTREETMDSSGTTYISGIAVYNYHLAPPRGKKGFWNVELPETLTCSQLKEFCEEAGIECDRMGHPCEHGISFVTIHCTKTRLKEILTAHPEIKMAEPDMKVEPIPEVEDDGTDTSLLEQQSSEVPWGLDRIDDENGLDQKYDVPASSGSGVHVYVVDTGVNIDHEKFQGRASPGVDCSRGNCIECTVESYHDNATQCGVDITGHGTHCGGTVGAADYGVAQSAHIHNVKMFYRSESGSLLGYNSAIIAGLDWIASKGQKPAVASLSVGGKGFSQALNSAVTKATNQGVTVIVAAGNNNDDACDYSLSAYADSISVGATTKSDKRSSYSNYGKCVDIFAPGSSIKSLSYKSNDGITTKSGTSMACPHVAGAAAVLLGQNPNLSPQEVRSLLNDQARCDKIEDPKETPNKLLHVWTTSWSQDMVCAHTTTTTRGPGWSGVIEGPCVVEDNCASSPNYPSKYGDKEKCRLLLSGAVASIESFETEAKYDYLQVDGGTKYWGTAEGDIKNIVGTDLTDKEILWSSDYSGTKSGWKLCVAEQGSATPPPTTPAQTTPAPTTPAPTTPAPTTPAPTTPAPTTPAPTTPAPTTPAPTTPAPTASSPTPPPAAEGCTNKQSDKNCKFWQESGYCNEGEQFHGFMMEHCKKACGVCEGQTPAPTTPAPTTPAPTTAAPTPVPTEDASTRGLKQILTNFDAELAADEDLVHQLKAWKQQFA